MDTIQQCSKCGTLEFDWWPEDDLAEDNILPHICISCVDRDKILIAVKLFMVLHRTRFLPEVFHFLFPNNWAQWSYLNNCQGSQRVQNLKQIIMGAPYTHRMTSTVCIICSKNRFVEDITGRGKFTEQHVGIAIRTLSNSRVRFDLKQRRVELPCAT